MKPGFVYLAVAPDGRHKIGLSINPKARLPQVTAGMELLHQIETDDMDWLEARMFEEYADQRISCEWFDLSAADVERFCSVSIMNRPPDIPDPSMVKYRTLAVQIPVEIYELLLKRAAADKRARGNLTRMTMILFAEALGAKLPPMKQLRPVYVEE